MFVFKQKTAYEMRISDWSSDVCSSDLLQIPLTRKDAAMTIETGDRLPEATLVKVTEGGPEQVSAADYFKGRQVAHFAVPGPFTPTCSAQHLPGYVEKGADLKAKGVDAHACPADNDDFVIGARGK